MTIVIQLHVITHHGSRTLVKEFSNSRMLYDVELTI